MSFEMEELSVRTALIVVVFGGIRMMQ